MKIPAHLQRLVPAGTPSILLLPHASYGFEDVFPKDDPERWQQQCRSRIPENISTLDMLRLIGAAHRCTEKRLYDEGGTLVTQYCTNSGVHFTVLVLPDQNPTTRALSQVTVFAETPVLNVLWAVQGRARVKNTLAGHRIAISPTGEKSLVSS